MKCIVNVATGEHYRKGQQRLVAEAQRHATDCTTMCWKEIPETWPSHKDKPYAFKSYALKYAAEHGKDQLLWADACIVPVRSLEPIWEIAAKYGAWIGRNGYRNSEWTADSAYPDLFPVTDIDDARAINRNIEHVVATAFALDLRHPTGRHILQEYYRLASETRAFCGPWINAAGAGHAQGSAERCYPCGPLDVRGSRHDQTALSVIAWRAGVPLTSPPWGFAYKGGETEETILVADGNY